MPKNVAPVTDLYIPNRMTRRVEWVDGNEPDAPPFKALIRSNLTFAEREALTFDTETQTADVQAALAPYVLEWNVGRLNEQGEPEAVPAPVDGGVESMRAVPLEFFWWLFNEIKMRGVDRLDPKPSTPPDSSDEP